MRSAIGLIAGPDKPAVRFEIRGLRVSGSIASAIKVLISERASAPASSATRAIRGILVTLGDSFTLSGRRDSRLHAETTSSSAWTSLPKMITHCFVLGQATFSSYDAKLSHSYWM